MPAFLILRKQTRRFVPLKKAFFLALCAGIAFCAAAQAAVEFIDDASQSGLPEASLVMPTEFPGAAGTDLDVNDPLLTSVIPAEASIVAPAIRKPGPSRLDSGFRRNDEKLPGRRLGVRRSDAKDNQRTFFPQPVRASAKTPDGGSDSARANSKSKKTSPRKELAKIAAANPQAGFFDGRLDAEDANASSVSPDGSVSAKWVKARVKDEQKISGKEKRLRRRAGKRGVEQAVLNQEIIDSHNNRYTTKLPDPTITNQHNSGRCWIFAGLNMIRSGLFAKGLIPHGFKFSADYIYFFSLLERSNAYLNQAMRVLRAKAGGAEISGEVVHSWLYFPREGGFISDGSWSRNFLFLADKYGLVPESAMSETVNAQSSKTLLREIKMCLAQSANEMLKLARQGAGSFDAKKAEELREAALARVWNVLAAHLGAPPKRFDYESPAKSFGKMPAKTISYTPKSFAKKFARFNPDDYVILASYPVSKGKVHTQPNPAIAALRGNLRSNALWFLNLEFNRLEEIVIASINAGRPVLVSLNISKDVDTDSGIMHPRIFQKKPLYGDQAPELSRARGLYFNVRDGNHDMAITGYDRPNSKAAVVKYRTVNSWGGETGTRGIYHMYRDWFYENVYEVIVHKSLLNAKELRALRAFKARR